MDSFSQSELILIKYANGFCVDNQFPNYFVTIHQLDTTTTINKAILNHLIEVTPVADTISKYTVPELNAFLSSKAATAKGNKATLVKYIIEQFSEEELNQYFTKRYYRHTTLGKEYLEKHLFSDEYTDRFDPILSGFTEAYTLIKQREYSAAEHCLKKFGHDFNELHHPYQAYDDFIKHPIELPSEVDELSYKTFIILYYMYGLRTESAIKDFSKRTKKAYYSVRCINTSD